MRPHPGRQDRQVPPRTARARTGGAQSLGQHGDRALRQRPRQLARPKHPDPIGHPGGPVNWTGDGQELVFIGSYRGLSLYDGHGRKVVELPAAWCNEDNFKGARPNLAFADVLGDSREELIHSFGGVVTVYTQDRPPSDPGRIYAPRRRGILSLPHWA